MIGARDERYRAKMKSVYFTLTVLRATFTVTSAALRRTAEDRARARYCEESPHDAT